MADDRGKTDETSPPKSGDPSAQTRIEGDAAGQFARSKADRHASGLHSANPQVLSGDGRAPGYAWDERPGDPEHRDDAHRRAEKSDATQDTPD